MFKLSNKESLGTREVQSPALPAIKWACWATVPLWDSAQRRAAVRTSRVLLESWTGVRVGGSDTLGTKVSSLQ